jgi:GNAT superfamily N-acetyltransferase
MDTSRFQFIKPGDLSDYRDHAGDLSEVSWPEFMLHDTVANEYWHELFDRFSEYQFALLDRETNRMAAMGNSLPFHWDADLSELPEKGWDWVFLKAVEDHQTDVAPNIQSAIQIAIHPDYRNQGLSTEMIRAMREIGRSRGYEYLVAPVRPTQKSNYPLTRLAIRCLAESSCAGGGQNSQTLSRSHDDPRHPRRLGGMDGDEISPDRDIPYPRGAQPDGNGHRKRRRGVHRA